MTTLVESHSHSCQYSSDGTTWTDFSAYVESFSTHHAIDADRGTCQINCYVYPAGLTENDYVVVAINGQTVFNGRFARPGLHGPAASAVMECEGRGAYLAKNWKADGVDPEINALFEREYSSQTARAIITNLIEAAAVENTMHDILGDDELRGTIFPIILRPGQTFWSLIRGDEGLDELSIAGTSRFASIGFDLGHDIIAPEGAGLPRHPLSAIRGGDAEYNAAALRRLLEGEHGAYRDAVLLNAAAALIVAGEAQDGEDGIEEAAEAIDKGLANALLNCWISWK